MKLNSLMRVILYSVCILFLISILLSGIGFNLFSFRGGSNPENIGNGTADPNQIRGIEIDWAAGSITIKPTSGIEQIRFNESAAYTNIDSMVWEIEEGILSIDFCEDTVSFGYTTNYSKDLVIEVPENWLCRELEIDVASAEVYILDMSIDTFDFDGASGTCRLEHCTVNKLDMDAASGDVYFSGSLNEMNFDGVSGTCTLVLTNIPRFVNLDGVSGDLDITLPSDCGFTVTTSGLSSSFHCEFDTTSSSSQQYVHGDGSFKIVCQAISGDVTIRKGDYTAQ